MSLLPVLAILLAIAASLLLKRLHSSSSPSSVAACRAAIAPVPGLNTTPAMRGGYMYNGRGGAAYAKEALEKRAKETSSTVDRRAILAFSALQGREGSVSAINTYDDQLFTWGTGWSGLGALPRVMDRLVKISPTVVKVLNACGVEYLGSGEWKVLKDDGTVAAQGKKDALNAIRSDPRLLALFVHLAEDQMTRDAVIEAQLQAFVSGAGTLAKSDQIHTQALYNFVTHLKHWLPGYVKGAVEAAADKVPGEPSEARDKILASEIVRHFYANAAPKVPNWNQLKGYALRDMKADGLDVSGESVFQSATPPTPDGVA